MKDRILVQRSAASYRFIHRSFQEYIAPLSDATSFYQRGMLHVRNDRLDEALTDFDRAVDLDPNDAWVIARRGQIYRLLEHYNEALADFDRAIELNPDDFFAIARRGATYHSLKRYEEALADFDRAIELNPDFARTWYRRAILRRMLGDDRWRDDLAQAITLGGRAYEEQPEDEFIQFNLALYHLAAGDAPQAEALYAAALAGSPTTEELDDAVTDLEQYLEIFPDDDLAVRMLARVGEARQ